MVKTQVQFEPDQLSALRRLAAEQGVSVSELVRRSVSEMLAKQSSPSKEDLWRRALSAAGRFRSTDGATDVGRHHDKYLAEIYYDEHFR